MKGRAFYTFLIASFFVVLSVFGQGAGNTGDVSGKVVDSAGRVIGGVLVQLESSIVSPISTTTDTNGIFRFLGLPPGKYSLTFFLQGYGATKRQNVVMTSGGVTHVSLKLELTSGNTGVISGIVSDVNGTAMNRVSVTLQSEAIPRLQMLSASDGSYRFENLPAGKYSLTFKKKGHSILKRGQLELPANGNVKINVHLVAKTVPEKSARPVVQKNLQKFPGRIRAII